MGQQSWNQGQQPGREPTGYVTNDPFAAPGYQQQPYPAGLGVRQFGYDAAHPPRPSVGFGTAVKLLFKNYANFYGRASRSEFWWVQFAWYFLALALGGTSLMALAANYFQPRLPELVAVAVCGLISMTLVVPMLALQVRRLHDAGHSGLMVLLGLLPGLGWIALLVMDAQESKPEGARFDKPDGSQPAVS